MVAHAGSPAYLVVAGSPAYLVVAGSPAYLVVAGNPAGPASSAESCTCPLTGPYHELVWKNVRSLTFLEITCTLNSISWLFEIQYNISATAFT